MSKQTRIEQVYGKMEIGDNGLPTPTWERTYLTEIQTPFVLHVAWNKDQPIRRISVHLEAAKALQRVLGAIHRHFEGDQEKINEAGADTFGGCYNYRSEDGKNLSMHGYGAEIDLGPRKTKKGEPNPIKDAFLAEGFVESHPGGYVYPPEAVIKQIEARNKASRAQFEEQQRVRAEWEAEQQRKRDEEQAKRRLELAPA